MASRSSSSQGRTPALVVAARNGDIAMVRQLIAQGHYINTSDEKGATALYWACCRGHDALCEFLLDAGCDLNSRVTWGATPLMAAADNGHENCVKHMIKRVKDLNLTNDRGDTALHMAAYRGYLNIVRLLTAAGANPFLKNISSLTPAHEAYKQQQLQCTDHLMQYMNQQTGPTFSSLPSTLSGASNHDSSSETSASGHASMENVDRGFKSWPAAPDLTCLPQRSLQVNGGHLYSTSERGDRVNMTPQLVPSGVSSYSLSVASEERCDPPQIASGNVAMRHADLHGSTLKTVQDSRSETDQGGLSVHVSSNSTVKRLSDFDTLSQKALTIQSRQGAPSAAAQGVALQTAYNIEQTAGNVESKILNVPKDQQEESIPPQPPTLPPRPASYKTLATPVVAAKRSFDTSHESPHSGGREHPRKTKHVSRELMPGVRVGEFVEQLQVKMVETEEKLSKSESVNTELQKQILILQQENLALKEENSRLQKMVHPSMNRRFQARGHAELDNDYISSISRNGQSCPAHISVSKVYRSMDNVPTDSIGRRLAVESSEHDITALT